MTPRTRLPLLAALAAGLLAHPAPLRAQGTGTGDGVRVGFTFGGISTVGFVVEYFDDARSLELTVGTWSFRDVSAALVVKEYFGRSALHPFVGAGVWLVAAAPSTDAERLGVAAVLHAPVGVDYNVDGRHYAGLALNVNRALFARRSDPEDDLPLNRRLVPLPGVYYRWSR